MSTFGGPCFMLAVEYAPRWWFESHHRQCHSAVPSFHSLFCFGICRSCRRRQSLRRLRQRRRARRCTPTSRGSTSAHPCCAVLWRSLMGFWRRGRSTATAAAPHIPLSPPLLLFYFFCARSRFRAYALALARALAHAPTAHPRASAHRPTARG